MTPPTSTPTPGGRPPSEPSHRSPAARRERRRVLAVAFGVSLALHALFIALYPLLMGAPDDAPDASAPQADERAAGTELVRLAEAPDDELEQPDEPETERPPRPRPPARPDAPTRGPAGEADEGEPEGLDAAERVRASAPDVRLIAPLPETVWGLSEEQIAQLELVWALEELGDSAAAAAEAYRAARDWTFTDGDGKRWGISSEGIHLGDVTLPLPTFGAPYDPEAWKGSMDGDLERAAGSAAARETLEDRARAIRERRDREREERPDTTRGGGGAGPGR